MAKSLWKVLSIKITPNDALVHYKSATDSMFSPKYFLFCFLACQLTKLPNEKVLGDIILKFKYFGVLLVEIQSMVHPTSLRHQLICHE